MASLDLCVYGTPHGFNSYEVPAAMSEYFERFYRTNRRGRMLFVNRRNDGSTIYSFLVYGLVESGGRQNAFFGTSFILRGNQFVTDLKTLYNLFNLEVDQLVARRRVIEAVNNRLKYLIGDFKSVEDVLNDYLNSILSGLSNFDTESYTPDFKDNNSGQIALKNIDTPTRELTNVFKTTRWLAVSPYFKPDEPRIEVDLGDLNMQYTSSLEQLTLMAINKRHSDEDKLSNIVSSALAAIKLLKNYAAQGSLDNKELQSINELSSKFNTLYANANTLAKQIVQTQNTPTPATPPQTQVSAPINQTPVTNTDNQDKKAEKPKQSKRKCIKCGVVKPLSAFDKDSNTCNDCTHIPIRRQFDPTLLGIVAFIAIIVITSWILINSDDEAKQEPPVYPETAEIDVVTFERALNAGEIDKALGLCNNPDEEDKVKQEFERNATEKIVNGNGHSVEKLEEYVAKFPNASSRFVGLIMSLRYTASQLDDIYKKLQPAELTDQEKSCIAEDINSIDGFDQLKQNLLADLNNKRIKNPVVESSSRNNVSNPDRNQVVESSRGENIANDVKNTLSSPKVILRTVDRDYKTDIEDPKEITTYDIVLEKDKNYLIEADTEIRYSNDRHRIFNKLSETRLGVYKKTATTSSIIKIGNDTYTVTIK